MDNWEFHPRGELSLERWWWRALNRDGSLHTRSRQDFDSFTKAFENAKSHGFDYKLHDWRVATPGGREQGERPGSAATWLSGASR